MNFFQPSLKLIEKKRDGSKVSKKYGVAKTPYQRILDSSEVNDSIKAQLKQRFEKLDPVDLLRRIENLQDALWQYAAHSLSTEKPDLQTVGQPKMSRKPIDPAPFKIQAEPDLKTAENKQKRQYRRRSTEPVVRYWRTRTDPFADTWSEIEVELDKQPDLTAKSIFDWLCQKYPNKFKAGQLRTLQRRVKEWRLKSVEKLVEESSHDDNTSQTGPRAK